MGDGDMSAFRMFEIFLLVMVNNVPYLLGMLFYPFRNQFRFSKRTTYILLAVLTVLTFVKECLVEMYNIPANISTIFTALVGFFVILVLLKARIGKSLMMLILVMDLSIIPLYLGKYTEGLFFYENSLQSFRWTCSLFVFFWEIPLFYVILKYIDLMIVPIMSKSHGGKMWNYLWVVPLTFFIIWNIYLAQFPYYAGASLQDRTASIVMILIISAGSLVIYHITFMLINERIRSEAYAAEYKRLNSTIDEARKARHDIRHHLVMIDTYLKDNKIEEVRKYLEQYQHSLPMEEALSFCSHYGINAVLTFTKQQANMLGADCSIHVNYPEDIPISEQDLTIMIGNLLENALDACERDLKEQPDYKASIEVKGNYDKKFFMLSIVNTSLHEKKKNKENLYISSKRTNNEGGIGISSVESVVKKYHGKFMVEQPEGYFKVSLIIPTSR